MRVLVQATIKTPQPCISPQPSCSRKSPGSLRNVHKSIQNTTYVDGGLQQTIDHRSVSAPLYSQPPSQLDPTEPCPRSGKAALQAPRVTGRSKSEDTNNPVFQRTYTASNRRPYAPGLWDTNGTDPGRPMPK